MARLRTPLLLKIKMRIDVFLAENGYTDSRTEAKSLILSGSVKVNDKVIFKPSFDISEDDATVCVNRSIKKYVSRGGDKLEGALNAFNLNVTGKIAIDIGASSGGFTDCLLQNGASKVICIDSGTNQLVNKLRLDERVICHENFNARYLSKDDLEYIPNLAVMDVSFISATLIIPAVFEILSLDSDFICLVKPQFEVGREKLGKGGIVKDEKARRFALQKVNDFAVSVGFTYIGSITSPIEGGDGNIEYLSHFRKIGR